MKVIFCCGSQCPEKAITAELEKNGIEVILLEPDHCYRNDADSMADQIEAVIARLRPDVPVAVTGSAAGAAAALLVAAKDPERISAVVAINGRTDLAIDSLRLVRTPTLLIVNDMPVLRMNREALSLLRGERRLEIIHGDDPETISHIVDKTTRWLVERLAAVAVA